MESLDQGDPGTTPQRVRGNPHALAGEDVTLQTFVNDQHGQELTAIITSLQFAPGLLGGSMIHQTVTRDLADRFEQLAGQVLDASYGYGGGLTCYDHLCQASHQGVMRESVACEHQPLLRLLLGLLEWERPVSAPN